MKYFPCLDEWVDPSCFSRGFKVECLNRHWKINVQSSARILDLGFLSRKHCVRGFRRQNKILRNEPFFCHYTCEHSKEKQCSTRYLSQAFIVLVMCLYFFKNYFSLFSSWIFESRSIQPDISKSFTHCFRMKRTLFEQMQNENTMFDQMRNIASQGQFDETFGQTLH